MPCPRCQHENRPQATFCEACGSPSAGQPGHAVPHADHLADLERLRQEIKEALEQQTATAEILRVIASSPTDLQPVIGGCAENAARSVGRDAGIFRLEGDASLVAQAWRPADPLATGTCSCRRETRCGRAVVDRRTIHVEDILRGRGGVPGNETAPANWSLGPDVCLHPLLREGAAGRHRHPAPEVRTFSSKQIELLETFADQAVIAIENVRLFTETQEALEQQTATGEILRVISQLADRPPARVRDDRESAVRLCGGRQAAVYRVEAGLIHLVARHEAAPTYEPVDGSFPRPPDRDSSRGRAILDVRSSTSRTT